MSRFSVAVLVPRPVHSVGLKKRNNHSDNGNPANLTGVPPWDNPSCSMSMSNQLNSVNPRPQRGGQNAWHAPSKQVSDTFDKTNTQNLA